VFEFQVKLRNDMPDDMLKDAIETSRKIIQNVVDFETEGSTNCNNLSDMSISIHICRVGLDCAEKIKTEFDSRWSPHWHCVIGRNFGSFVTHETKNFIFFYLGDKAVMLFKAG
jgi:dynein light chain LC8-type